MRHACGLNSLKGPVRTHGLPKGQAFSTPCAFYHRELGVEGWLVGSEGGTANCRLVGNPGVGHLYIRTFNSTIDLIPISPGFFSAHLMTEASGNTKPELTNAQASTGNNNSTMSQTRFHHPGNLPPPDPNSRRRLLWTKMLQTPLDHSARYSVLHRLWAEQLQSHLLSTSRKTALSKRCGQARGNKLQHFL